jgi:hypothetical protein
MVVSFFCLLEIRTYEHHTLLVCLGVMNDIFLHWLMSRVSLPLESITCAEVRLCLGKWLPTFYTIHRFLLIREET